MSFFFFFPVPNAVVNIYVQFISFLFVSLGDAKSSTCIQILQNRLEEGVVRRSREVIGVVVTVSSLILTHISIMPNYSLLDVLCSYSASEKKAVL